MQPLDFSGGFPSGLFCLWCSTLQDSSSSRLVFPSACVPAQQWLSVRGSTAGELGCRSCVLPEDLLVTILSERLQVGGVGAQEMVLLESARG